MARCGIVAVDSELSDLNVADVNLIGQLDQDSFPIASSSSGRGVLFEEITR